MDYRLAGPADVAAMATIRAAEWETEAYWQRRLAAYMDGTLDPQKALKPRVTYVAVHNGEVVGFVSGHLTQRFACAGELEFINVVPAHRGSGVAAELLRCVARWFVEQSALRVCVDPDGPARRFYTRHGAISLNHHWLFWPDVRVVLAEPGPAGFAT